MAVDQLFSDQPVLKDAASRSGEKNITVGVSQFPVFAAGCLLYVSSPNLVCRAANQGEWGVETNAFIHKLTHTEGQDGHTHVDLTGLLVLIHDLHHYYEPSYTEVSTAPPPQYQFSSKSNFLFMLLVYNLVLGAVLLTASEAWGGGLGLVRSPMWLQLFFRDRSNEEGGEGGALWYASET